MTIDRNGLKMKLAASKFIHECIVFVLNPNILK